VREIGCRLTGPRLGSLLARNGWDMESCLISAAAGIRRRLSTADAGADTPARDAASVRIRGLLQHQVWGLRAPMAITPPKLAQRFEGEWSNGRS
jgi:hypothetical protein